MEINQTDQDESRHLLNGLAFSLLQKRDLAIQARASSGVERRWREDQEVFDGLDGETRQNAMIDYATGEAAAAGSVESKRSKVLVNLIRGKCETAEGRFSDIQMPVDDKNWGLKPTPVPELVKGLKNDKLAEVDGQPVVDESGNQVSNSQIAQTVVDQANDKMALMETEIEDQLTECSFNAECRKIVKDATRLGTGILKGPLVVKKLKQSWVKQSDETTSVHVLEVDEEFKPVSRRVDPWFVFPDPECGEDIRKAAYIWEADQLLPRDVRNLIGVEGYYEDQIRLVLEEDPKRTSVTVDKRDQGRCGVTSGTVSKGSTYERWEYNGDVDREDLFLLGCDCEDSVSTSVSACVVFVNDRPIKVMLNSLDTGDLPYDFFQWTVVSGSPWGIGIPRQGLHQQRIITAALRDTMDNAGVSSGVQIVLGAGLTPADGVYEITKNKIWYANGTVADVEKAFAQFQIKSVQKELQAIIEMALKFLDMETSLPMLFQGEKAEAPKTLGATNIMVDANNVALRSRVKTWDDQITIPHIKRYYHWNMQYSEKQDIKGDYNVDARGSSVLYERDQEASALTEILQLRQDPELSKEIDWPKALKQLFRFRKLNILKSEEDKRVDEQNQPVQQGDPKIEGAQAVATIRAEGEMAKAELVQKSDMAELEFKAQQAELEREHDAQMKAMDYQMKMMEFSQQSGLSLEKIKAELAKEASKQNLMRELADKKTAQLTTPPVEPPQRAKPGEAYQQ